jgi:MFS family permease
MTPVSHPAPPNDRESARVAGDGRRVSANARGVLPRYPRKLTHGRNWRTGLLFGTRAAAANCAATLLIRRASQLFDPAQSEDRATQLAILFYVGYNVAAALISVPAGHHADRHGAPRVLAIGAACFAMAYLWFAIGPGGVAALAPAFFLAGIGIGCAETAEHAAVATLAPSHIKGSAFGLLAGIQAAGNLAASTIAGEPLDNRRTAAVDPPDNAGLSA